MATCKICNRRSRYIVENSCDDCKASGKILEALVDLIDDKIRDCHELNTEEPEFRWLASLAALYSDYRSLAHIYKYWTLIFEYIRHPGDSVSSRKIIERVRSLRDVAAWERFYENIGLLRHDGGRISIVEGSIAEKARITIETRTSDAKQRASFCVVGYVLLRIAEAIFNGRLNEIPDRHKKMRRFIASIPFFLTRFVEDQKVRRSEFRRFLASRGVSMTEMIEKIEASLAGSDTKKRVDWFKERRWWGIDEAVYEPDPYVISLFERVREYVRERGRKREREVTE